jgi:Spy/CpxP family protein refolding chaperone
MNSTKTLFLAALATGSLLVFSPAATAADTNAPAMTPPAGAPPPGARGGPRGGPTLDQIAQQLNLTDDQKAKVKPILDTRDQKMKDLRADTTLSQEDRRTKMQTIRQETTDAMKGVLTPEQFDKYQEMQQRARNRAGGAAGGGAAPAAPPATPPQN